MAAKQALGVLSAESTGGASGDRRDAELTRAGLVLRTAPLARGLEFLSDLCIAPPTEQYATESNSRTAIVTVSTATGGGRGGRGGCNDSESDYAVASRPPAISPRRRRFRTAPAYHTRRFVGGLSIVCCMLMTAMGWVGAAASLQEDDAGPVQFALTLLGVNQVFWLFLAAVVHWAVFHEGTHRGLDVFDLCDGLYVDSHGAKQLSTAAKLLYPILYNLVGSVVPYAVAAKPIERIAQDDVYRFAAVVFPPIIVGAGGVVPHSLALCVLVGASVSIIFFVIAGSACVVPSLALWAHSATVRRGIGEALRAGRPVETVPSIIATCMILAARIVNDRLRRIYMTIWAMIWTLVVGNLLVLRRPEALGLLIVAPAYWLANTLAGVALIAMFPAKVNSEMYGILDTLAEALSARDTTLGVDLEEAKAKPLTNSWQSDQDRAVRAVIFAESLAPRVGVRIGAKTVVTFRLVLNAMSACFSMWFFLVNVS